MATADDMLSRVKVRLGWPDTEAPLEDAEILEFFDSEIKATLFAQLHSTQGDWHLHDQDYTLTGTRALYRLPARVWGPVKDVGFIVDGEFVGADVVNVESLGSLGRDGRPSDSRLPAFAYLKGDHIGVHPATATGTLRVIYYRMPNRLVLASSARQVVEVVDKATYRLSATIGTFNDARLDFIGSGNAHQVIAESQLATSVDGSAILTMAGTVDEEVEVGDWVSLAGTTPVAQIPDHMEAQLLQRVKMLCADSNGDEKAFARSALLSKDHETRSLPTIDPRQEASPQIIRPSRGFYR